MNLDKEVNYITATELLLEVQNTLSTFFERSLLDDSIFFPVIKRCLDKLGMKVLPISRIVIPIKNYEGTLPFDFYKLISATGCFEYEKKWIDENPQVYEVYDSDKFKSYYDYYLLKPTEVRIDPFGDEFFVMQRYETFAVRYNGFYPLSIAHTSYGQCASGCLNKSVISPNKIEINGKRLLTSFSEGSVFIEYLQSLEKETVDGVELVIPNYSPITEWIIYKCIYKGLEKIYLNQEADVQQRLQFIGQQLAVSEANALTFVSKSSIKELYDYRNLFFSRFKKFNDMVFGPKQPKTIYGPNW